MRRGRSLSSARPFARVRAVERTPAPPDTLPPSVPTGVTGTPVSSNRVDLAWTASNDDVEVIGYTIYRNGAFLFALTPFLFATYSEDPTQEKAARGRTLTYLTFVLALGGLVLTLFAHEILSLIAPRFESAYKAVGPLMLGMLAYGLVTLLATGIALARSTGRGALLTVLAAGINIGLNFALIPPYGVVGAAFATTIGYGFLAIGYYLLSQHLYPTPYEPGKALLTIGAASAFGVLGAVGLGPEALAVLVKLGAIAGFVLVIWGTGTMRQAEFAELKRFLFGMIPLRFRRAGA